MEVSEWGWQPARSSAHFVVGVSSMVAAATEA